MQTLLLILLSAPFVVAGVNQFVSPDTYVKIMPGYLPWPLALVYVSGFFELLGGVGVAVPRMRRMAGWGLLALLGAVFPANVHMVVNADQFDGIPFWALMARLPLQGLLMLGFGGRRSKPSEAIFCARLELQRSSDGNASVSPVRNVRSS